LEAALNNQTQTARSPAAAGGSPLQVTAPRAPKLLDRLHEALRSRHYSRRTEQAGSYAQARPNVIFELGWFYGSLGHSRVCILFKNGTQIHSDLGGISRVQFADERELVEANMSKGA
jgi:hypothetical protein